METDVLIGLRFEVSGGLGKMAGVVVGKAGALYLVQRDDTAHLELLELSDLKAARFYPAGNAAVQTAGTSGVTPIARSTAGRLSDKIRRSSQSDDPERW